MSYTCTHAVPDDWCRVSVSNLGGENALHLKQHSLLCTVTAIPGMTLPPLVEWVGPDGTVLLSGGNMTVGSVNTQGSVSTFSLSFNPVLNSDGGTYTCRAAVHVPWMSTQPRKISTSFDMPVTSESCVHQGSCYSCMIILYSHYPTEDVPITSLCQLGCKYSSLRSPDLRGA